MMRDLNMLNQYRRTDRQVRAHYGGIGDDTCGVFELPSLIDGASLLIVASAGEGWDHVSVSRKNRCPNWPEMEHVKRLFFEDDEIAMQLHVAIKEHISVHPHCLHIWRPHHVKIPLPPPIFVGRPVEDMQELRQMGLVK